MEMIEAFPTAEAVHIGIDDQQVVITQKCMHGDEDQHISIPRKFLILGLLDTLLCELESYELREIVEICQSYELLNEEKKILTKG